MNRDGRVLATYSVANLGTFPDGIIGGPDGNIWVSNYGANAISKITPAGTVTPYALPGAGNPNYLCVGPDGALWYGKQNTGRIGRITTAGVPQEFDSTNGISVGADVHGMTLGPDGNIWFTEFGTGKVAKFIL